MLDEETWTGDSGEHMDRNEGESADGTDIIVTRTHFYDALSVHSSLRPYAV